MSGFSPTLAEISRSNRDIKRWVDMLAMQMAEIMSWQPAPPASSTRRDDREVQRRTATLHDQETLDSIEEGSRARHPAILENYRDTFVRQAVGSSSPREPNVPEASRSDTTSDAAPAESSPTPPPREYVEFGGGGTPW